MLKRYLFAIVIVSLAIIFATNTFGQNNKRTKPKTIKGKVQFQDFHFGKTKPKSNQRKPAFMKLGDIKGERSVNQRTTNTSGNINKPLKNNVPRQGGGTRGRSSQRTKKPSNFSPPPPSLVVDTQIVGRKKPKNSHNLLPYIEQNNRRKPKARN